jgi:hypothetical protein
MKESIRQLSQFGPFRQALLITYLPKLVMQSFFSTCFA